MRSDVELRDIRRMVSEDSFSDVAYLSNASQNKSVFLNDKNALWFACHAFLELIGDLNLDQDLNGNLRHDVSEFAAQLKLGNKIDPSQLINAFKACVDHANQIQINPNNDKYMREIINWCNILPTLVRFHLSSVRSQDSRNSMPGQENLIQEFSAYLKVKAAELNTKLTKISEEFQTSNDNAIQQERFNIRLSENQIRDFDANIAQNQNKIADLSSSIKKYKSHLTEIDKKIITAENRIFKSKNEINTLYKDRNLLVKALNSDAPRLKEATEQLNYYLNLKKASENKKKSAEETLAKLTKPLEEDNSRIGRTRSGGLFEENLNRKRSDGFAEDSPTRLRK